MIGKYVINVPAGTARGKAPRFSLSRALRDARQALTDAGITVDSKQWLADIGRAEPE